MDDAGDGIAADLPSADATPTYPLLEERSVEWLLDEYETLTREFWYNGRDDTGHLWKLETIGRELTARGADPEPIAKRVMEEYRRSRG